MKSNTSFLNYLKVFFILQVIFFGFATLSVILPYKPIKTNIRHSIEEYKNEEVYPQYFIHGPQHQMDYYTDYLVVSMIYNVNPYKPFKSVLYPSMHLRELNNQATTHIQYSIENPGADFNFNYQRYWLGSSFAYRWLFLMGDLTLVRWLMFSIGSLSLFAFVNAIQKNIGKPEMFILAAGAIFTNYYLFFTSFQYLPVFVTTFLGTIALIKWREKGKNLGILFLILGAITVYLDILTTPVLSLGIPLLAWIALQDEIENLGQKLKKIIGFSLLWSVGFFATWLTKWLLVLIFDKNNSFVNELKDKITERAGLDAEVPISALGAIQKNIELIYGGPFWTVFVILTVLAALSFNKSGWKKAFLFLSVATIPFLWGVITKEHIDMHFWFTYRSYWVTISGVFLAINAFIDWQVLATRFKRKKIAKS